MKTIAVVLLLLVASEGCGSYQSPPVEQQIVSDLGIGIFVDSDCPGWAHAENLRDRVDALARVVSLHAAAPAEELAGWLIVFRAQDRVSCDSTDEAFGCVHVTEKWIEATCLDTDCVETTILAHELLHVWFPDPKHTNPQWKTLWGAVYSVFQRTDGSICQP
jgi:hypothetical protein